MAELSHAEYRCLGFISKATFLLFERGNIKLCAHPRTGAYFGSQPDLMVPEGGTNKCWLGGCSPMDFKASGNVLLWEVQIFRSQNISECLDPLLRELLVHGATLDRIRQDETAHECSVWEKVDQRFLQDTATMNNELILCQPLWLNDIITRKN